MRSHTKLATFSFNLNNMTDRLSSIFKLKKNLMKLGLAVVSTGNSGYP